MWARGEEKAMLYTYNSTCTVSVEYSRSHVNVRFESLHSPVSVQVLDCGSDGVRT